MPAISAESARSPRAVEEVHLARLIEAVVLDSVQGGQ
jgi:hypothetical protein